MRKLENVTSLRVIFHFFPIHLYVVINYSLEEVGSKNKKKKKKRQEKWNGKLHILFI